MFTTDVGAGFPRPLLCWGFPALCFVGFPRPSNMSLQNSASIVKYNRYIHNRQSIRLREYDYSQPGAYFITVCTQHKECNLGELINGEIQFTVRGMIASVFWLEISHHFSNVELDQFILMPNHIHGIIFIKDKNIAEINTMGGETQPTMGGETPPLREGKKGKNKGKNTLGQIVAYYKYRTTKIINQIDETPGQRIWQRNFYDRIIRTEKALHIMRQYIATNPQRWNKDLYNPRRGGVSPPF